jgi:segregation and condensation protein B
MLEKIVTLLYLSGDPLSLSDIAKVLGATEQDVEAVLPEVDKGLRAIGLALLNAKDGISIVTQATQAPLVEAFWKEELEGELTPATLQVLTLVAYLGSPTREEISYIRGVQSSQSIRTLSVRGLITRQGETCSLTGEALKHLGVTKNEELPDYEKIHTSLTEKLSSRDAA